MTMRRSAHILALLFLALLAAPAGAQLSPADQREEELGQQILTQFEKQLRPDARVDHVAAFLLPHVKRTTLNWEFFVLKGTDDLNAFALPGGKVVITELYLNLLGDDELAFVLGHEITHVDQRHHARMARRQQNQTLARVLLGVFLKMGTPEMLVLDVAQASINSGFSRDLETEADQLGFERAVAARYDAAGGIRALASLQAASKGDWLGRMFATHPKLKSRIAALEAQQPAERGPTRMPFDRPPGAVMSPAAYWGRAFLPEVGVSDLALTVDGALVSNPAPDQAVRAGLQEARAFRIINAGEAATLRLRVRVSVRDAVPGGGSGRRVVLRSEVSKTADGSVLWTPPDQVVSVMTLGLFEGESAPGAVVSEMNPVGAAIFDGAKTLANDLTNYFRHRPALAPPLELHPGPQPPR